MAVLNNAPELYPEFFNDVFGPIMQPGSSSHTAAPCRLGYVAHSLLGEPPRHIEIILDEQGSFAGTFGVMSEDSAMIAGALGMLPDDARLFTAPRLAAQQGITYNFEFAELRESAHPNAMKFVLTGASGKVVTLVGDSTGGGMIETKTVNGYPLRVKGDCYVVLIFDPAGMKRQVWKPALPLVGTGVSHVPGKGALHFYKTAAAPDIAAIRELFPDAQIELLKPVLPVITRPDKKPQLFDTMTRWREIARERGLPLWEIAVQYEMDAASWSRAEVLDYMRLIARKMHHQTHAAYEEDVSVPDTPFKPDMPARWEKWRRSPRRLTGDMTAQTLKYAYGAGAGIPGVETVAGPMGSGGGYVYAALCAVKDAHGFSDDDLLRGLFVAAGIGAIAFTRTEPTGECVGCSGECGICGAMAAAGIAEMAGGAPEQVENAASLLLQAFTGLPCDPIPGGKGQPCRSRIIAATCMASVCADLALAGHDAVLPLHEAIDVVDAVGRRLPPELLCTSQGGASVTPTARERAAAFAAWFEESAAEARPPGNLI